MDTLSARRLIELESDEEEDNDAGNFDDDDDNEDSYVDKECEEEDERKILEDMAIHPCVTLQLVRNKVGYLTPPEFSFLPSLRVLYLRVSELCSIFRTTTQFPLPILNSSIPYK